MADGVAGIAGNEVSHMSLEFKFNLGRGGAACVERVADVNSEIGKALPVASGTVSAQVRYTCVRRRSGPERTERVTRQAGLAEGVAILVLAR